MIGGGYTQVSARQDRGGVLADGVVVGHEQPRVLGQRLHRRPLPRIPRHARLRKGAAGSGQRAADVRSIW